jgi:hypothetical protein
LLIWRELREFLVSCYDAEMRDPLILFVHLLAAGKLQSNVPFGVN